MTGPFAQTRRSYDAVAAGYAEWVRDDLARRPLERSLLAAFAELVTGPVADVGCGPGRVTAHLAGLGVDAFGIDLSPRMVALARRTYPDLRFVVGAMPGLGLADGSLGGLVAWYSTIHVPDELLPAALAGFHRVLAPGGHALLAFQAGEEPFVLTEAFGHQVALTFHRRQPEHVARLLADAGLEVWGRVVREPDDERTPQAFLLARRPARTAGA